MKDWKVFPDLEQRLQPGGVQQTVEDLGPVDVLAHRLSHLVDHIRQDLTQACSAPTPERLLEQKQEVVPGPAVKYISPHRLTVFSEFTVRVQHLSLHRLPHGHRTTDLWPQPPAACWSGINLENTTRQTVLVFCIFGAADTNNELISWLIATSWWFFELTLPSHLFIMKMPHTDQTIEWKKWVFFWCLVFLYL